MVKSLNLIAGSLIATALAAFATADDHKHPNDKCPPGRHTVTIERSTDVDVKPGGVGGGHTLTEKREVCRDNKHSGVKENSGKNNPDK